MEPSIKIPHTLQRLAQDVLLGSKTWDEAMQKAHDEAQSGRLYKADVCLVDACIADLNADHLQLTHYLTILAALLCNLVPVYQDMGDLQRARQCCENSLSLAKKVQDTDTEDICYDNLGNLGIAYRRQGQPKEAVFCFEQVLAYKRDKGDRQAEGLWLSNLAAAQCDLGQLEAALDTAQTALKLAQQADDIRGIVTIQNTLGTIHYEMGWLEKAMQHYQASLDANRRAEDYQMECAVWINMGLAYRDLRQLDRARECHKQALALAQRIKDRRAESFARGNLGLIQRELGQAVEAANSLEAALQISHDVDLPSSVIYLNNLGLVRRDLGQIDQATCHFQEAFQLSSKIGDPRGMARSLGNLGILCFHRGQIADARARLVQALFLSRKTKDWENLWRLYRYLGEVTGYGCGRWAAALRYFERAIHCLEVWRTGFSLDPLRRQIMQDKATTYRQAFLAARRLERFERALELAEQAKTRYLADVLTRRDQRPVGVPEQLLKDYVQVQQRQLAYLAIQQLVSPDASLPSPDSEEGLESLRKRQQQLLKRSQESQEELAAVQARLDKIIEQIHCHDPNFQTALHAVPLVFDQVFDLVPIDKPRAALVEFVVTPEGTAIFIVTAEQKRLPPENLIWVDNFTESDLDQLMAQRDEKGNPVGGWVGDYLCDRDVRWRETLERITGELWDRLFARVHARLKVLDVKRLILIPHQALHLLPLHALHRPVCGRRRYLLDDYDEITFAPSSFVLGRCLERASQPERRKDSLLTVANTRMDLPYSEGELALLNTLFARHRHLCKCLRREQGTREAVMDNLMGCSYVHFACHGKYNWKDPLGSALYLYPPNARLRTPQQEIDERSLDGLRTLRSGDEARNKERSDMPAGLLTLREIQDNLDLSHVRLITLSACETAMTDPDDQADEYVGLPAGFLMAGVPAVVASLWAVDDLATMLLMERFYMNYLDSMSLPGALQNAQCWLRDVTASELVNYLYARLNNLDNSSLSWMLRAIIRGFDRESDERPFEHPFYWSAFTFSGV